MTLHPENLVTVAAKYDSEEIYVGTKIASSGISITSIAGTYGIAGYASQDDPVESNSATGTLSLKTNGTYSLSLVIDSSLDSNTYTAAASGTYTIDTSGKILLKSSSSSHTMTGYVGKNGSIVFAMASPDSTAAAAYDSEEIYAGQKLWSVRIGSSGDDTITTSNDNDYIDGAAGHDALNSANGNDTIEGNTGNDTLTGGAGSDDLDGGSGRDTIILNAVVGRSCDSGRVSVNGQNNDKGQDTLTSFSLTEDTIKVVAINVSHFVHGTDTTLGAGTGTEVDGNRASFTTSTGLIELNQTNNNNWSDAGDIAVTFASPSTTLTESRFEARLQYSLTGNSAANTLTGGALNDTLQGGSGNDSLTGGSGNDILYGGAGQDIFRFDQALSATLNLDQIKDFVAADDTIQLENSIFTKFGTTTTGTINSAYFKANTTGQAADSNDYIIYETDTGKLFYDSNGNAAGGSVQIALLGINLTLTYKDFVLV